MHTTATLARLVTALLLLAAPALRAEVALASVFGAHMVLQQGLAVPVWGTAAPGEAVTVTFGTQTVATVADAQGAWRATLAPLAASATPATLTVTGTNTVTVADVLVGEVWLASGQSNMEWGLGGTQDAAKAVAAAEFPAIRCFTVEHASALTPQTTCKGAWQVCTPQTAGGWSATAFYFGRELHQRLQVPVGLIVAAYGGTRAEPWLSLRTLAALPVTHEAAAAQAHALATAPDLYAQELADAGPAYAARRAAWYKEIDARDPGIAGAWMKPNLQTVWWRPVTLPCSKAANPLGYYHGSLWFRKEVTIPPAWVGQPLELHLGTMQCDETYVNGTQVGRTWFEVPEFWKLPRVYPVPATAVTGEKLMIAVRLVNLYYDTGLYGPAEEMTLRPLPAAGAAPEAGVSLAGPWSYHDAWVARAGEAPLPLPKRLEKADAGTLAGLYNGMIAPLVPYAVRGALWYQGESNAPMPEGYGQLLCCLVISWRVAWGLPDMAFAVVQLPNYLAPQTLPVEKASWAELRAEQATVLSLPHTTLAITMDLGEADNIHPKRKAEVGHRLALGVLADTYHQPLSLTTGPRFRSVKREGGSLRLQWDFATGLAVRGERLAGFAIAGEDRIFHWADARIEGETVLISSPVVTAPVAVRYAWANNPPGNLINSDALPAAPCRSDDWPDFGVASEPATPAP